MEFTDVRNMIDSTITENGRNEITGLALNAALTEIVDIVEEALDTIDPDAISTQIDSKVATSVAEAKTEITTTTNESISTLSNEIDARITELENRPVDPGIITFWGIPAPSILEQPYTLEEVNALLEQTPDDPELLYLQRIISLNIDSYNDIITNGLKQFIIRIVGEVGGYTSPQMVFINDTVITFLIFTTREGAIVAVSGSISSDGRITCEYIESSTTE